MIVSFVRQLVVLVPVAYLLARYGMSVGNDDLVWLSYPIAEIASLTMTIIFYISTNKKIIKPLPDEEM